MELPPSWPGNCFCSCDKVARASLSEELDASPIHIDEPPVGFGRSRVGSEAGRALGAWLALAVIMRLGMSRGGTREGVRASLPPRDT